MKEFQATHVYNGLDGDVYGFLAGEEVMFVRNVTSDEDGFSEDFAAENGVFVNSRGSQQYVYLNCVEAI